jgi:hypothetical protein
VSFLFHLKPFIMAKQKVLVIDQKVITNAKVQEYLSQFVDVGQAQRALSKGLTRDAKLNNFIKASETGFEKGNGLYLDKERRARIFEACSYVGMTSIEAKQAAALFIVQTDVDSAVEAKRLNVTANGTLELDNEQKASLEGALKKYSQFLSTKIRPAVQDMLAHELCVATIEERETEEVEDEKKD